MPSIYDIDFSKQSANLLPPDKRLPKWLAFIKALVLSIQTVRDLFFDNYADGSNYADWVDGSSYTKGTRLRYIDNKIYEAIVNDNGTHAAGVGLDTNPKYILLLNNFIGIRERLKYNSRKIVFEFLLNKYFRINTVSDPVIFITNNNIYTTAFFMGATGPTSSSMAKDSTFQKYYLGNAYVIGNNDFTINVPVAVFDALDPDPTNAENIIRAIADKYVIGGIIYNVITY